MSRFFALSRTSHAILDIAAPAFCALLWLGRFPPWQTVLLSLFTAFAAYTAVYALNDLLGIQCDRQKFAGGKISRGYAVEASSLRHPLAQGILSLRSGLIWTAAWSVLALAGSYLLNPLIVFVLLAAVGLEVIYCLLQKVSYLRTLVSGVVKTSGPIAAILVVDHHPDLRSLLIVFVWLFLWEIGGQNIPSDWNYSIEDQRASARTIPIRFGLRIAGLIVMTALGLSVTVSLLLPLVSPARLGLLYVAGSLLVGYFLLLRPGYQLASVRAGELAARLFDHASYYPLSQFLLVSMFLLFERFNL